MTTLTVISGAPNSGKLAAMWAAAARDPNARVLHRDQVRVLFGRLIDEAHLTYVMRAMAETLLRNGYSVVTCGQNQSAHDAMLWEACARVTDAELRWLDTADEGVVP